MKATMNKDLYPPNWKEIALERKIAKDWTCEICHRKHNLNNKVQVGVHHRDGDPGNCNVSNLQVLCRRCHLREQLKLIPYMSKKVKEALGQIKLVDIE